MHIFNLSCHYQLSRRPVLEKFMASVYEKLVTHPQVLDTKVKLKEINEHVRLTLDRFGSNRRRLTKLGLVTIYIRK